MSTKIVRSHPRSRKYSVQLRETALNKYIANRVLVVRKLNSNDKSNQINKEINDYFDSPEKYFQKNSPVAVGKKIILFDINENNPIRRKHKLKTEKKHGINLFNHLQNLASNLGNKTESNNILGTDTNKVKNKNKGHFKSRFEIIDNERLKIIFDLYKNTDKFSKDNSFDKSQSLLSNDSLNKEFYKNEKKKFYERNKINITYNQLSEKNIPSNIRAGLNLQAKKLNLFKFAEMKNKKFSKYLSKKVNKPQKNLLLNRIDSFRFKKEVIKEMESKRHKDDQERRKFIWNINLRKPDHFKGVRSTYVNIGEKFNPFWSLIVEKCPKKKEIIIKPEYTLSEGEIHNFKKQSKLIKRIKIDGDQNPYFQTIEDLDKIIVKGKNLFNLEYKREIIDSKNKKIWHKVFLENGKAISLNDVNKLYGNETFYENYNGSVTEKNSLNKFSKIKYKSFE